MNHKLPADAGVSPEDALATKAASRMRLLRDLDSALLAARTLCEAVTAMCPEAVAALEKQGMLDTSNLSVEQKLELGEQTAGELTAVVFNLAPEVAFSHLEAALPSDRVSQAEAAAAIAVAKGLPLSPK